MSYLKTYLPVVTWDYFGRLQNTHAETVREMPNVLRSLVQPWFSDPDKRDGRFRGILFQTAMNGSLGNFLGDIANGGEIAPTEERAEIAKRSARVLALTNIIEDTILHSWNGENFGDLAALHNQIGLALGSGMGSFNSPDLWLPGQTAAKALGRYLHTDLGLVDESRRQQFCGSYRAYTNSLERQLKHKNPEDVEGLIEVAKSSGAAVTRMVLDVSEMIRGEADPVAKRAVKKLGEQAGLNKHGSLLSAFIDAEIPTYGEAMIRKYGPVNVDGRRRQLVSRTHKAGREGLNPRQADIYDMAGMLIRRVFQVRRAKDRLSPYTFGRRVDTPKRVGLKA